jgi:hypothetical protein
MLIWWSPYRFTLAVGASVVHIYEVVWGETREENYSRTPLIRINWDDEPSGYAEKPDNWIVLWQKATLAVWSEKKFYKQLFKATYLLTYKENIMRNSLYLLDNCGRNEAIKRCSKIRVRKCLPERPSHADNQRLDKWSSNVRRCDLGSKSESSERATGDAPELSRSL